MAAFDPAAATAAYMASVSPAAHAKAIAYTQGGHWLLLWGWAVGVLVAVLILRSGLLARTVERIEKRRPRPILSALAAIFVFLCLDFVLELPWTVYAAWFRERQYGLTSQSFSGWFAEDVLSFVISLVVFCLFLSAVYALIRTAPRTWWAWAGGLSALGVVVLLLLGPILIEPLFNRYTPAPPGPVRDAVVALAKRAGVPYDKIYIYNGSKQSNRYTANVSGLGSAARVAMSDSMFAKGADISEVRGVVGHEMGHYKHGHVLWGTAAYSLIAALFFWLIARLFPWAARRLGSDADSIADPSALPVVAILFSTLALAATPLLNTLTRLEEADADRFSLRYAQEPDGLARALVKTIEYRASSPSSLEEFIFYDHPSVERRVRQAMEWKARHQPS